MEKKNIFWKSLYTVVWAICTAITIKYSYELIRDYQEMNPISLTTYMDTQNVDRPGYEIVNNAYLDPQKILNFNRSTDASVNYSYTLFDGNLSKHITGWKLKTM